MRKSARKTAPIEPEEYVYAASDNLFADLGLPDAGELMAKADLARAIRHLIEQKAISQRDAARLLGAAQPDISNLYHGRLDGFSIERLCRFLNALGQDVRIVVQPKPRSRTQATMQTLVRGAAAA
jgi:predicted XRE-type DNA-binding protein